MIYVGSSDGFFYAIKPDGTLKWTLTTTNELDSSPAIGFDGTIYFGSYEGKLYARNPNGIMKWTFDVDVIEGEDSRIISSPAVDIQDNIYFGSGNNIIYSLDSDGNINWSFVTNGKIDTSPALGPNGNVYFATREGFLYCLDDNGIEQWSDSRREMSFIVHPLSTAKAMYTLRPLLEVTPAGFLLSIQMAIFFGLLISTALSILRLQFHPMVVSISAVMIKIFILYLPGIHWQTVTGQNLEAR